MVSLDLKAAEPAIHALAAQLGVPARFFPASRLEAETPRLANPSAAVFATTGCHGVAEGAALAAVGPDGRAGRGQDQVDARHLRARPRAPAPLDPARIGRPRGVSRSSAWARAARDWRTAEASALLADADDWVGYAGYLDLIPPPPWRRVARHALRARRGGGAGAPRARSGRRRPAGRAGQLGRSRHLRHGGPGAELLERGGDPAWQRVAILVSPGVSALQAAAARAGAPLGHDFCAVSLSDLLTPWAEIERRLRGRGGRRLRRRRSTTPPPAGAAKALRARSRSCARRARPKRPLVHARNLGRAWRDGDARAAGRVRPERGGHAEPADRRLEPDADVCDPGWPLVRIHAARLPSCRPSRAMTVHFIGAGPGAPDLITVRGLRLVRRCPVVLYAGSLVPTRRDRPGRRGHAARAPHHRHRPAAIWMRSSARSRRRAARASTSRGCIRAIRRSTARSASRCAACAALGIPYDITPGVPAFAAAAAALEQELTLPGVAQSVVLTRTAVRASPMPARRDPGRLRRDRRHARDPPVDQQSRPGGARADARYAAPTARSSWCTASPGRTSASSRHAGHDPGTHARPGDHAHRADPGRARAGDRGLRRQPPVCARPPPRAAPGGRTLGQTRSSQASAASTESTTGPGGGGGRRTMTTGRPQLPRCGELGVGRARRRWPWSPARRSRASAAARARPRRRTVRARRATAHGAAAARLGGSIVRTRNHRSSCANAPRSRCPTVRNTRRPSPRQTPRRLG